MQPTLARGLVVVGLAASLGGCSDGGGGVQAAAGGTVPLRPGNVLVIVVDDVGVDRVGCYGEHPAAPPTPNIDRLAAEGLLFRAAYAQPWCSPTRAAILTGRWGFRTGIGNPINQNVPDYGLDDSEVTLAEVLESQCVGGIDTTAIGKWHLASTASGNLLNANEQGFDWFEGLPGNFVAGGNYFSHQKLTNGLFAWSSEYATSEQVDDCLRRIGAMREPWFTYLAFNAAHEPFHAPPPWLHTYTLNGEPAATPVEHVSATVQALDTELGRLLASMDPLVLANTTIIFLGDNGTDPLAIAPPWPPFGKSTLREGGVRVPMIVWGHAVDGPGREVTGLVQAVDLFATVAELFGVDYCAALPDQRPIDSISFAPVIRDANAVSTRTTVYCESFSPNGPGPYSARRRMLRDERWKYIDYTASPDEFFDMQGASFEGQNLLGSPLTREQSLAFKSLRKQMRELSGY